MVDFDYTSKFWFGGVAGLAGDAGVLILEAGAIVIEWLVLYFLYKKNVFWRV
jgi:hypothetical protein